MDKRGWIMNRNALGYQDDGYEVDPQSCAARDGDMSRARGMVVSSPIQVLEMS
jgi:hypothetical protein